MDSRARGPQAGDAASLWNFTPSPGWTKDEVAILRLCLLKYGVGRWAHILSTGLLPGKLIQQLSCQTQRLLGQQSLAAYTGQQVDIDRIRAANEARKDGVERKQGLIINSGPNPTRALKLEWRRVAKAKYGLTPIQIARAEAQLEAILVKRQPPLMRQQYSSLMEADPTGMSREQKLALLGRLRTRLQGFKALRRGLAAEAQEREEQGIATHIGKWATTQRRGARKRRLVIAMQSWSSEEKDQETVRSSAQAARLGTPQSGGNPRE